MKKRSNLAAMARLIKLVEPLTKYMFFAVTMGTIGNLCATFITVTGTKAILGSMGFCNTIPLLWLSFTLMTMAAFRAVLRYGEQSCNHFIAFSLLAFIRDKVFKALRVLSPAKLEGKDRGDIISVITSDIELLEVFYAHTISPIAIALIYCAIMLMFIVRYNVYFALWALIAYVTVGFVLPVFTSGLGGESGLKYRTDSGMLSGFVLDSLRGLNEILQYRRGQDRLRIIDEKSSGLSATEKKIKMLSGFNQTITGRVILCFDMGMIFICAIIYRNGNVSFEGTLLSFVAFMSSFGPVTALSALGATLQNTFAAANRVLDILDEQPVTRQVKNGRDISFSGAKVENVCFRYKDEEILSDVNIDIPLSCTLGIVGKSGSGKSTLLKLLMRFWDTGCGRIKLSGENIKDINTLSLRENESYMTQSTYLFHGSIADNLRIAKPDATTDEMIIACKKASVHEFIASLEKGYDTPVGELGRTLSGGERQRLGLAMAFLHGAPLMLLDEPTSNLDSINEAVILKALAREKGERTVVLVSHRPSTVKVADCICNIDSGRIS